MTNVLILAGGNSDESEVSRRSGAAVTAALTQAGFEVASADSAQPLSDKLLCSAAVVFPVLHGAGGEDGILQARLEALNQPFVGSGSQASALCFDKWQYKQALLQAGSYNLPAGAFVDETEFWESNFSQQPFILKPHNGGSSVDNYLWRDSNTAIDQAAITALFKKYPKLLVEELIIGNEITAGVLGDLALPIIEIIPPNGGEFNYENKYNGQTQELCPPQSISIAVQLAAQTQALAIHKLCGCRDFSRTDFIVDSNDQLWVLETNTIPGMTDQSLLPKAAAQAGLGMPELTKQLVTAAQQRSTA